MSEIHHDARRLSWDGCPNARDLGNFPVQGGGRTRPGAIARSDSPNRLTARGQQSLLDHGVRTIVDLRLPDEAATNTYPFVQAGAHGVSYRNVSFIDPLAAAPQQVLPLADDYKGMLVKFRSRVAAAMQAIASAPEGGVLIHCAAGKDRTGLIAALLLDLVGVSHELIAEDYALSSEYLRASNDQWLAREPAKRKEREEGIARGWSRSETMREVLAWLAERYSGAEQYLREAGLTEAEIAALGARLLEPPG